MKLTYCTLSEYTFCLFLILILFVTSCNSINNYKVSQGGIHLDFSKPSMDNKEIKNEFSSSSNNLQESFERTETEANLFDFRRYYNRGSNASYYFYDQLFEDKIFSYKGGDQKMTEVNDIISNLSSFIICGYTLIKSIMAIISKIKSKN